MEMDISKCKRKGSSIKNFSNMLKKPRIVFEIKFLNKRIEDGKYDRP
jgi:hypothetical protein